MNEIILKIPMDETETIRYAFGHVKLTGKKEEIFTHINKFSEALEILREVEAQLKAIKPHEWHGERINVQCYGDGVGGDCEHSPYRHPCEGHKLKKRIEEFNKKIMEDNING